MNTMIVMEIHLILFHITIKLRKILLFVLLITFLRQQNDVYLHLGGKFQNNKTDHRTFDFSEKYSRFSIFLNRKLLNSNDKKTDYAIN